MSRATGQPSGEAAIDAGRGTSSSPRGRRRGRALAALVLSLSMFGLVLAAAATSGVRVAKPLSSVCLGSTFKVGVRYRSGSERWFKIRVLDPSGKAVWAKKGLARKSWRYWQVKPAKAGRHRVVYTVPNRRVKYVSDAVGCQTETPPYVPPDGPILLTDNDGGTAALLLADAAPGRSATACLLVAYTGGAPATVRLYGATGGSGLDPYLELTVTRGVLPSLTVSSCSGFVPDAADYIGAGSGVVYRGSLQAFPDDYLAGVVDPVPGAPEPWTDGERHAYRLTVGVLDDDAAQGRSATQSFTWEARSG